MYIEDHKPYLNSNGKEIVSVTTVLKILNKPELVQWANYMGFKKISTAKILKETAQIGTCVHHVIERLCENKISLIDLEDIEKKKQIKRAVKNFKNWDKDYKPKYIHNELRLQCDSFGGTIDCICKIDDKKYMIDFKTSKQVYPTHFLQLAAYNYLYKLNTGKALDNVAVLVLDKKNKKYNFTCMDIKYLEKYYEPVFFKLLSLYNEWTEILYYDWNKKL